jgi:LacI family transcriptional regulator
VASLAAVSIKTVSRVINNEPGVSELRRTRVEDAIRHLGYAPDQRARLLAVTRRRAGVIGFVAPAQNSFYAGVLAGVESVTSPRDVSVSVFNTGGLPERQAAVVDLLSSWQVDAFVVFQAGTGLGPLEREHLRGTPIVFVDRDAPANGFDVIRFDHEGGARLGTEHLIEAGHRAIAYIGPPGFVTASAQRIAGYHGALERAHIKADPDLMAIRIHGPEEWATVVTDLLTARPDITAIFSGLQPATVGAVTALHALGLHQRVALVGIDDFELATVIRPAVTVLRQDTFELGRLTAERIFDRLGNPRRRPIRKILPMELLVRGSGEITAP